MKLYVIRRADFDEFLARQDGGALLLVDHLVNGYINMSLQLDALTRTPAHSRLLYTFRHLCLCFGKNINSNQTRLQIPLTQQEIANYSGLTRETTTLELNKLRIEGVIWRHRKYYSVDVGRLDEFIDDPYNPGVKSDLQTLSKGMAL